MIVCSQCQSENPLGHRFCQQCGASLKLWRAIVTQGTPAVAYRLDKQLCPEVTTPVATGSKEGDFLDQGGRYRLLDDLALQTGQGQVLVTDKQPAQPLPSQQIDVATVQPLTPEEWTAADLPYLLPAAAYPYLKLREQFFPTIPELHAAWFTPERSVIVIEDRSELTPLFEIWRSPKFNGVQHEF